MANIAAKLSLNVPAITALCKGEPGASLRYGVNNPTPIDGNDGDFWLNTTSQQIFGPKSGGIWPSSGVPLNNNFSAPKWDSVYDTVSGLSASWVATNTTVFSNSGDWNNTTTRVRTYSADWTQGFNLGVTLFSTMTGNSASWGSTNTSVYNNSARWDQAFTVSRAISTVGSVVALNSGSWNDTYTWVRASSGAWGSSSGAVALTVLAENSASWNSTNTTVYNTSAVVLSILGTNSASWRSTNTSVYNNSGNWNSVYSNSFQLSSDWQDTFTWVRDSSATWGAPLPDITALTDIIYSNSANWDTAYSFTTYYQQATAKTEVERFYSYPQILAGQNNLVNLKLSAGNHFLVLKNRSIGSFNIVTWNEVITYFTLDNAGVQRRATTFVVQLCADGTPHSVPLSAWPASIIWANGQAPTTEVLSWSAGQVDTFTFIVYSRFVDGQVFGFISGLSGGRLQ